MKNTFRHRLSLPLLILCSVIVSGCSTLGLQGPPEEVVAKRAQAWADALLAGNLEGAYKYTSPNYRQFATMGRYHARVEGTWRWEVADVSKVECEPEACTVTFDLQYDVKHLGLYDIRRPKEYRWVLVENRWWLYVPPK